MPVQSKCRFGIHLGLGTIAYAKIAREAGCWRLVSSGDLPWHSLDRTPDASQEELGTLVKKLAHREGISRESVHISLHSRYCVTRVVTGSKQQVEQQFEEIAANSHHYLQLGLGAKLMGHSNTPLSDSEQYGQVAIIKRGLIESIEKSIHHCSLELESVDGALPSISRLIGLSGLDRAQPILVVSLSGKSAEIAISYQGRLQLSYHIAGGTDTDHVASTISKHLKRLKRFCNRYRAVDGHDQLRHALVLAEQQAADLLKDRLQDVFEHVYTREDFSLGAIHEHLTQAGQLVSAGVLSALGGLLVHLEPDALPYTDVFEKYLASKPRSLVDIVVRDGWTVMVAAALMLATLASGWYLDARVSRIEEHTALLSVNFGSEREKLLALDRARRELSEYRRLQQFVSQVSERTLIMLVASCLPEDTRIEFLVIDAQDKLVLKGSMLRGDRTFEVLTALRDSPLIAEVALESVGKAINFGVSKTTFEIHCSLVRQPANSIRIGQNTVQSVKLAARPVKPRGLSGTTEQGVDLQSKQDRAAENRSGGDVQ